MILPKIVSKLKILFLTQILPFPLVGGAKIRAYFVLRYLAESHHLTLVSFTRSDDKQEDIEHLEQYCESVFTVPMKRSLLKDGRSFATSLIKNFPMVILRDRDQEMEALLSQLMIRGEFDVIHADQTSMAYYAQYAKSVSEQADPPSLLLDQHNALFKVVERQSKFERGFVKRSIWQHEARRLARYEGELLRDFDEVLTVTAADRQTLLKLLPKEEAEKKKGHITTIPICVDPLKDPIIDQNIDLPQILHLGTMFWPPNIEGVLWFSKEVLPLIIDIVPDVSFIIAGKNPPSEIQNLGVDVSPIKNHILVTGFVADPQQILLSSKVFVVPLLAGGGMRVKILDAWQWGIPIVSTRIGAEGIDIIDGENILLADDPQSFAVLVSAVLTQPDLARNLRDNGRKWVKSKYNWRIVYPKLDGVMKRMRPEKV